MLFGQSLVTCYCCCFIFVLVNGLDSILFLRLFVCINLVTCVNYYYMNLMLAVVCSFFKGLIAHHIGFR